MRLDIEALRVLDVVIEEGSFAKAAARLHKAQSAISYQIKKLEDQLDVTIFDRSSYRAELTPKGKALWVEGRRLLQQAERIEKLADHYSEGWEPHFDLVVDASLPMEPVMKAMKVLVDREIPTKIQVKVEAMRGVQKRFEQDKAHMMLVKDYHPSPQLKPVPLPEVTFVLVASCHHALAAGERIDLNQLLEHVELTIHDSSEESTDRLDEHQFGGDRVFFMHGFVSKKSGLKMGLGFGWMPEFLIREELVSGELVELDYEGGSRSSFTPLLVYPTDQPLGKAGELILQQILSEFATFKP
ncbi:LysR family transcriptional regulator [Pontibacterium sp. N1Y112]|uniref:LysR family transcriptional regulator n=1 Tax=Pontibacterium sinense TaxID=2781979 RepID=A0A8J7FE70_9GAMM|nr:LysR family transcriptional regulator [Pontibacterium sinense]